MQMTHEQQRICNHNVGSGETIKIVAFAGKFFAVMTFIAKNQIFFIKIYSFENVIKIVQTGTGKTTTLVRYTQLRPSLKFLLIVYNRYSLACIYRVHAK